MGQAGPEGARTRGRCRGCACAPDAGRVVFNARQMTHRRVRRQAAKSAATGGKARPVLASTPTLTPFSAAAVYPSKAAHQDEVSRLDAAVRPDMYLPHDRAQRQTPCWTALMRDSLASPPQETAGEKVSVSWEVSASVNKLRVAKLHVIKFQATHTKFKLFDTQQTTQTNKTSPPSC